MHIAIFDNLANSAYVQAKAMRAAGTPVDLVLDPLDDHAMSDPRWEDLDLELPTDGLLRSQLPSASLPDWVRFQPGTVDASPAGPATLARRVALAARAAPRVARELATATRIAGVTGAQIALTREWVLRTLKQYDCVIAYGTGCAWTALAGVPTVAYTWGGDITMAPFYDTGGWEGHESMPLPGPKRELFAQAKLVRNGYRHAGRIVLADPRFEPFADRLGHASKSVAAHLLINTEMYAPGPEPELRAQLLDGHEGLIVFVPSRQDWFWKGSDRLLRGFAQADKGHARVTMVCAGWGADVERSRQLIAELGIGERVRMLSSAMSKARLRRFYRAADVVADQFTVGSYGTSTLEAMSCGRPVLISLDEARLADRFSSPPPVVNVTDPDEISQALSRLLNDPSERARIGARARDWVVANHGPGLAQDAVELCRAVIRQERPGTPETML